MAARRAGGADGYGGVRVHGALHGQAAAGTNVDGRRWPVLHRGRHLRARRWRAGRCRRRSRGRRWSLRLATHDRARALRLHLAHRHPHPAVDAHRGGEEADTRPGGPAQLGWD